ncbi:hypothetical protein FACS189487_08970 [Campylobacterota bacterium]|nr:hypothetical protein FACS189487_08970 [Campylobacterota bacterium]
MDELEQIEQKFGFKYPDIYRNLYQDGMLDWFRGWNEKWTKERNWGTEVYPTLLDNPPLLLFGTYFELLDFNGIAEAIMELKDPDDYRQIKPEFMFVPFAQTGAGDLYVFQFDRQNGDDIPITLVYHDDNAVILAKNLQDFIFRMLLESVLSLNDYSKIDKGDFTANRANILKSHRSYLSEKQVDILSGIYARELKECSDKGLIALDELQEILQQEIGFAELDMVFEYMG